MDKRFEEVILKFLEMQVEQMENMRAEQHAAKARREAAKIIGESETVPFWPGVRPGFICLFCKEHCSTKHTDKEKEIGGFATATCPNCGCVSTIEFVAGKIHRVEITHNPYHGVHHVEENGQHRQD